MQLLKFHANQISVRDSPLKQVDAVQRQKVLKQFDKHEPILIDYGTENIRAGYASSSSADMIFRPYVTKNRDPNRAQQPIKNSINISYEQLNFLKQNYKALHQRNIILHYTILQQCNDYIFSELTKNNARIQSTLIINEPFGNPIHCRQSILELYFECYQIQRVMIGVDSLFRFHYENMDRKEIKNALVIDIDCSAIHIFCVVEGKVDFQSVIRINLGINESFELFSKTVLLKNPQLRNKFTYSFMKELYDRFTCVALDYRKQLRHFSGQEKADIQSKKLYRNRVDEQNKMIEQKIEYVKGVQIDFDQVTQIPEEQIKRKQQIRHRMAQKLRETIERRKETKKKQQQEQLENYYQLKKKFQEHDLAAHEEVVEIFGHHKPHEKLVKKIKNLELKLGIVVEDKSEEKKFSLINIPDHELPPDKLKYKRMQIYQKKAMQERRQKQRKKQEQQQKMRSLRQQNPQLYLQQLRQKYNRLKQKAKQHQRLKSQIADRKSKYNKKKMQFIARLAEEDFNEEEYEEQEQMEQEKQEEEEDRFSQLEIMEAQLREIDPQYEQHEDFHHLNSTNQLFLMTELIKCHEIYFDPQIIGLNQEGIVASIVNGLALYDNTVKKTLLSNIWVVGSGSQVTGLKQRLAKDLRSECPVDMDIEINIGKGGAIGAFLAMQQVANKHKDSLNKWSFSRSDYFRHKQIRFVQNPWSNPKPKLAYSN